MVPFGTGIQADGITNEPYAGKRCCRATRCRALVELLLRTARELRKVKSSDLTGTTWRKSSHSNAQAECVEVAFLDDGRVATRDTKHHGGGAALTFNRTEWAAFQHQVARSEFTQP
ncbi:DUF397 domain-containing protein [Streptomyces sp. NPDC054784]